jgi:hypothetical protein
MGDNVEAWLSRMNNYFQFQNYSIKLEDITDIYNLQGNYTIWWDHLRKLKRISERNISWKQFKNHSQQKYHYDASEM